MFHKVPHLEIAYLALPNHPDDVDKIWEWVLLVDIKVSL